MHARARPQLSKPAMYHPAAYAQHAADQPHQANEPGQYAQPVYMPVDSLQFLNLQINHQTGVLAELSRQIKDLTEKVSKPESDEARKAVIEQLQAELIQLKHERDEALRKVAQFVKVEHERDEALREVARLTQVAFEARTITEKAMLAQNKPEVERCLGQAKQEHDKELAKLRLELTVTKQKHAVELQSLNDDHEKEFEDALGKKVREVQQKHAYNEAVLKASILAKEQAHQLILEQHASQVEELTTALETTKRDMSEQTEKFETAKTHLMTNLSHKKTKIQEQDQELVQAYSEIQRLLEQAQLAQLTQEPKPEPTKNAKQTLAKLEKLKAEVDQKQVQLAAQAADLARREKELDKRASLLKKEAEKEAAQKLAATSARIEKKAQVLRNEALRNSENVLEEVDQFMAA
jgi:hypothetical protein